MREQISSCKKKGVVSSFLGKPNLRYSSKISTESTLHTTTKSLTEKWFITLESQTSLIQLLSIVDVFLFRTQETKLRVLLRLGLRLELIHGSE